MKMNVIITGATGMVGEGVLHECINHASVHQILLINRKPLGIQHKKVKELICQDLADISQIEEDLTHYNACFFCAGVTSVGKTEAAYARVTHDLTLKFATTLSNLNPELAFCYVSGAGTDSSEQGPSMWARVKGRTENDLMDLPFKSVYNFRPGLIKPTAGLSNTLGLYKLFGWLFPLLEKTMPARICTLSQLGRAMINAADLGFEYSILEIEDIKKLSTYRRIIIPLLDFGVHQLQQT